MYFYYAYIIPQRGVFVYIFCDFYADFQHFFIAFSPHLRRGVKKGYKTKDTPGDDNDKDCRACLLPALRST